jgi:hypothetical protein
VVVRSGVAIRIPRPMDRWLGLALDERYMEGWVEG